MDRNTIIGFSLIFLILTGYYWYTAPTPEQQAQIRKTQDSLAKVDAEKAKLKSAIVESPKIADSSVVAAKIDSLAQNVTKELAQYTQGTEKSSFITNKDLTLTFSNKGGTIQSVKLNQFKRADSTDLILLEKDKHQMNWSWNDRDGKILNSKDFFWEVAAQTDSSIKFAVRLSPTSYIEQTYTLKSSQYVVGYSVNIVGMDNYIRRGNSDFKLNWDAVLQKQEKDMKWDLQNSAIVYKMPNEEPVSVTSTEETSETLKNKINWVGFKQQYFSAVLASQSDILSDAKISMSLHDERDSHNIKKMSAQLFSEYKGEPTKNLNFSFYFGPNHYKTLENTNIGVANAELERIIPMGWGIFGWVNRGVVIPVFAMLGNVIGEMGIIIMMLTFIIKMFLLPLVYKSYISTAKMRILKPEIDEIKEKHGSDMQKVQADNMALYKKAGVSPLSGCVPMLLQLPILFAMFQFFPVAFELRQKSFLWSHDLSRYDSILDFGFTIPFFGDHLSLFTLLMTVSTLIYTHLNNQISGVTGQMKWIGYFMPIIFLGVLNDYASGLTWYYFVSNMITFGQQYVIRKMVDDKKLHAQISESRKKPVVKSNFQKRMEAAMKASQQKTKKR